MPTVYPFRALRPNPELAAKVASVPYDVVNREEAQKLAKDNPHSFLHVTKPEIDATAEIAKQTQTVYQMGADALKKMVRDGVLVRDEKPCYYIYELMWRGHTQTGVVMLASAQDYRENTVRKHEHTRPDKENDRVNHMRAIGAQSGTVFLVHRDSSTLAHHLAKATDGDPIISFRADDRIYHRVWVIDDDEAINAITAAFAQHAAIYIADGHHRSAAASRVALNSKRGEADQDGFLAVSFAASEMQILPYNRAVKDLNGHSNEDFMAAVRKQFAVSDGKPEPITPKNFGMFFEGAWFSLAVKEGSYDAGDSVASLDVSLLQDQLLTPVLGIKDPRLDTRIDFVGGIRGDAELERLVGADHAVAFKMHATSIDELLTIADAGQVMPPKSTWFEPKLRDGLFVHMQPGAA